MKTMIICSILISAAAVAAPWTKGPEANRPALFKTFGDIVNTPEGLALDKEGNLYLSAINGVDPSYSGHIWKRCVSTGKWSVFAVTRADTKSGKSFPQGIVFGDDGNLYYAENQYFADRNYASTVRRIVVKDGEPQRCETVVEHAMLPNGLRWRDDALWFSESFAHHGGKFGGGIYRIPAKDLCADKPARLLDKDQMARDPYCIAWVPTELRSRNGIDPLDDKVHIYTAGPDGIDFDADGNLYTGSFGDGRFWRIRNLGGGRYAAPELLDDSTIACCDGICHDAKRNRIILTAAAQNALYAWNIAEDKMELVWANGDTDGADGLFDQPSEVLFLPDGRLVVVNIDAPSPGMVNSGADKVHTLSVIRLPRDVRSFGAKGDGRTKVRIKPLRLVVRESTEVYPVDPPWLAEALVYICRNAAHGITAADVLAQVGLSHTTVGATFRRKLGVSVQELLMRKRLEEACRLLRSGLSVTDVARKSGFSSVQYFCRAFAAVHKLTPSAWQAANGRK